jgi:hypothetical protein
MKHKTILNSFFIIYILLSGSTAIFAQGASILNPKKYQYSGKHYIFEDDFDNNKGWVLNDTNTLTRKISYMNGKLFMENRDTITMGCEMVLPVNQKKDFEIEIGVQIILSGDKEEKAVYLAWGMDTIASAKDIIQIAQNGKFNFAHCLGNDHKGCIHDYGYFHFKKDKYNFITIRKVAQKYYIFFNGQLSEKATFHSLSGNIITLGAGANTIIAYDYISISYLE